MRSGARWVAPFAVLALMGGSGATVPAEAYEAVQVHVPTVTDDASRKLLGDFAARHPENPREAEKAPGPVRRKA